MANGQFDLCEVRGLKTLFLEILYVNEPVLEFLYLNEQKNTLRANVLFGINIKGENVPLPYSNCRPGKVKVTLHCTPPSLTSLIQLREIPLKVARFCM